VVRAVHKFAFKLVMNEAPTKRWPMEKRLSSDKDSCFWQDFSTVFASVEGLYSCCTYQQHSTE